MTVSLSFTFVSPLLSMVLLLCSCLSETEPSSGSDTPAVVHKVLSPTSGGSKINTWSLYFLQISPILVTVLLLLGCVARCS